MIARLVDREERAAAAYVASAGAAIGLVHVLLADLHVTRGLLPVGTAAFGFVAALMVLAAVAPWLVRGAPGRVVAISCEPDAIVVDGTRLSRREVTGLSVARGQRGLSVAACVGERTRFFEVESAEDAARIVASLGSSPVQGRVVARAARRELVVAQAVISAVLVACAPLYFEGALGGSAGTAKLAFGLVGIVGAVLALLVFVATRRLQRRIERDAGASVASAGRGRWREHVALHFGGSVPGAMELAMPERPAEPGVLARGELHPRAWLAQLDALCAGRGIYRDGLDHETLAHVLADEAAPVEARIGAARLLRRGADADPVALVRVVADPDVKLRVALVVEHDEDHAGDSLARLGPVFRAR